MYLQLFLFLIATSHILAITAILPWGGKKKFIIIPHYSSTPKGITVEITKIVWFPLPVIYISTLVLKIFLSEKSTEFFAML